ncbi:PDZ domain-containing protein [Pedobacter sp. KBS0701]|uniref:aspartyl protease family protein n=2 Tax=unclassified Pedobacter TaxID=2628915 RepID=UPI00110E5701|nr:aspartyl protease family protein [Pedobacter sp. KBS0701]QDW27406.1 PDZ domain-containing protein [Pedobacter sp. KBS0701]
MLTKYSSGVIICLRKLTICLGLVFFMLSVSGQEFLFKRNRQKQSISFKCIKNLMVIPVFVNGKGPYDFVLDTGVGPMIITDPSIIDSLNFSNLRKIKVSGLGIETIEAYVSQSLDVKVGSTSIKYIPTAILKEDLFNLSGHLGLKIYGLLGFSFFNSFIVDIRYSENRLIIYDRDAKVKYRGKKIPIEIENQKPYVVGNVELPDGKSINARFLMDTGASHALSLEMLQGSEYPLPEKKIKANLGMSLSGQIKGYIGRVGKFSLGNYVFNDVVAGFPDFKSIAEKIDLSKRNGNLGADLLRRFNIQFNYQDGFIYLKTNGLSKIPFEHDMVGMVLYLDQKEYKRVLIGEIDENSPAEKAGLCTDDEIIAVNFKNIDAYSLNDLNEMFKSKADRNIILEIFRDNQVYFKVIRLEKRI